MEEKPGERSEYRRTDGKGELCSRIEIRAPPERIWEILADFPEYPDWNPFMRSISGNLATGEKITVHLQPPGAAGMTMRPLLITINPPWELRWLGHLFVRGLFDGEHSLEIRPLGNGSSRFTQRERFSGVLLPLFEKVLKDGTSRGFDEMNKALKARAELPAVPDP